MRKKKQYRKVKNVKSTKNRRLDIYDTKCYFKDLDYLARLSYLSDSTRSWIEARRYELRASANIYEHMFGELLINQGIDFIHQAPFVFRPRKIYFCDFYLPKERIAIEIDGIYHNSELQLAKDAERDENFNSIGIRVLRITNEETKDKTRLSLRLQEFIKPKKLCLINLIAA